MLAIFRIKNQFYCSICLYLRAYTIRTKHDIVMEVIITTVSGSIDGTGVGLRVGLLLGVFEA